MYKRLGRILGLAVVLAGLTTLAAYDLAASNVEGKVVEIDSAANRVVVETSTGSKVIVMSDPQTMILSGNESKRLADIHVGDRVKVSYTTAGATNTATDIEVVTLTGSNTTPRTDSGYAQNDPMARSGSEVNTAPNEPARTDTVHTDTYAQNSGSDMHRNDTYDRSGTLPQTGSSLPLVGLAGLLLVGLGIAFRIVRMNIS
jgi:LPXTG-motif cell wall-anchored protein